MKLLPYILFEKYVNIFIIGNGQPLRGTGTVPIVSAHFRLDRESKKLIFNSAQFFLCLFINQPQLIFRQ